MYGYQGQYSQPPGYGSYPGAAGAPPGMGPPPGTAGAPGMAPPGTNQTQSQLPPRPGGLPPNFQAPANMPNINFSAPVIRLGTTGPTKDSAVPGRNRDYTDQMGGGRRGLGGMDRGGDAQQRQQREAMAMMPPTREEIMRTIFVGKIPEAVSDEDLERILRAAGSLRRWTRAFDAANKPCSFGFAEYEDAESLETAADVLQEVEVPAKKIKAREEANGDAESDGQKSKLLIQVDEASMKYAEEWREKRGDDATTAQFRIDTAKETLSQVLSGLFNPRVIVSPTDRDGDTSMVEVDAKPDPVTGEVITISLAAEDDLSDIPPAMRETVAAEISAFRERSNRRDLERLRREEEIEIAERRRNRVTRLASPPPASAPTGPAGGANGIPLGARDRVVQGAPSGPKALQGGQIPRDYQNGVTFVNGDSNSVYHYANPEEEESDASDGELERRRQAKREAEQEKLFLDYERRWLNRERSRAAAIEREKGRDQDETDGLTREKDAMAKRLKDWNDDAESSRKSEEYYRDRSQWLRNRSAFRSREVELDDRDRAAEDREKARETEKREQARGMADSFLDRQAEELGARAQAREPQRLKISLGAAAQRAQAAAPRRTVAEVEGLLEDEEEAGATSKRTLIPIKFDSTAEVAGLSEEERQQAARQLAAEIPTDKEGLWQWNVQWEFVDEAVITEQLRPFVEKKIVEYLGVQEQMLIDVVEDHIKKRGSPEDLVKELEGALDEEAEVLVKKLWRMIIFWAESEKRGLSN